MSQTKTVQDCMNHALTVAELGGRLFVPELPSREQWGDMLERYAPGCGSPTHVAGTNGGLMPCGENLTDLNGVTAQYFCAACEEQNKKG